jgi:hypothetical protein
MAADSHTCGPGERPLITFTGSDSVAPVTTLAKGSSNWILRPGGTVTPPTVMGPLVWSSGGNVVFYVLDDLVGDVYPTGRFDALETW